LIISRCIIGSGCGWLIIAISGIFQVLHQSSNASSFGFFVVSALLFLFLALAAVVFGETLDLVLGQRSASLGEKLNN